MRLPTFRVRTLMLAVVVVALVLWGGMMGFKSYGYSRLAREYATQENGWREIEARNEDPKQKQFHIDCIDYFAKLSQKYRRAMWRPWMPADPDPHAPGWDQWHEQWLEEQRRAKEVSAVPQPQNR